MYHKPTLKILFFCLFLAFNSFGLTLEEVIQKTTSQSNESIKYEADIASYGATKYKNFEETFMPSVSLEYERNDLLSEIQGPDVQKSINIGYNVSNLYKNSIGFYGGIKALDKLTFDAKSSKNILIIEVISIYFEILEAEKSIKVYEKSLEFNETKQKYLLARIKRGSEKPSALYLIEAEIEEVKSSLELEKQKLETAKSRFFAKTGMEAKGLMEPKKPILSYKSLEDLLIAVKKENLTIKSANSNKIALKYNLAKTSSDFLPDLSVTYQKYNRTADTLIGAEKTSRLNINATFYLYKPGLISDVIQKGYEYRSSKYDYANTLEEQLNKAREFWSQHEYYEKVINSKQKVVKARSMLVEEGRQDTSFGRIEFTDRLEEEKRLREAELDLIKTKFNAFKTIYEIKNIAGEMLN